VRLQRGPSRSGDRIPADEEEIRNDSREVLRGAVHLPTRASRQEYGGERGGTRTLSRPLVVERILRLLDTTGCRTICEDADTSADMMKDC
jgi:hypothetical protein